MRFPKISNGVNRTLKLFAPALLTLALMCVPLAVSAVTNSVPGGFDNSVPGGFNNSVSGGAGNETCAGGVCSVENPLKVSNFCDLLRLVLNALIIIGLPVAVVFLILVGFQYILAQGKPADIGKAHQNLLYTVIGIAIFLGAWTIAEIIKATLQALGVSGFGSC